ncbi:MAG: hypothetical protein ABW328_18915 [Ilumatobacteraceae bacterium]
MAEPMTDDHLDAVLASLGDHLDVPPLAPADRAADARAGARRSVRRRRVLLAAAALVVAAVAAVLAISPAREAVARWFGLHIEHDDATTATGSFAQDVTPLAVDAGVMATGIEPARFTAGPLGDPDAAGAPPEGGVLLAWDDGTTLWVRPAGGDLAIVKRLGREDRTEDIAGVGDFAVLIEGEHVLQTPSRIVAAGRVLWWITGDREHRLESDATAAEMIAIGRALGG